MRCPSCNQDNPDDASFCEECGAKLELICPACKASVSPGARFCKKCGTAIGPTKAAASTTVASPKSQILVAADGAASEAIDGERKTVTALFADIKGSMELMEDLDPEDARAIVDPALKLMIEAVRHYGGYIVQSTGDGIFALFGAPVAHEDHPQRALYAALRLQEEMHRYSAQLRKAGNVPVEARVGMNTGEVVVRSIATGDDHPEYTPIGHSTSLAARMQALAPTGSIAATDTTRKLCEGYFTFRTLGPARIKGVSEAVEVFEVTGLGPLRTRLQVSARRGLTKFVGRERELEALRHAAELARTGHGQLVAAIGEPGVGKSRLFREFKVTSRSGWMALETFSVSHGKASAYLPVIELLHSYFGIEASDDGRKRREKLNGRIVTLDPALEDTRPYLFGLLGLVEGEDPLAAMDGQVKKRRTLEAIKRILLRESLNQPLMVIFEDLHWIDEQPNELLNLLADSIGTAKILLLVNYRPEYRHDWGNKTYYTQLRLDPLGKDCAEEMLEALLSMPFALSENLPLARSVAGEDEGAESLPTELPVLKRLIVEKTDGNPFFMEEIVQALFEEGALVRNGKVKLTRSLKGVQIPASVEAILAARIDRLPQHDKELLQTVAVLGKEFTLRLLHAVWEHPHPRDTALAVHLPSATPLALSRKEVGERQAELERRLAHLQSAELIYEQPAAGDIEYTFKHALTQEVAYKSILLDRRKRIHERAASAIESMFAPALADHYEDLAHHYGRSGNALKTANYLRLAAQQAISRSAYAEAALDLTTALETLRTEPNGPECDRAEVAVLITLASCVSLSGGYGAVAPVDMLERARAICETVGDDAILFEVLEALAQLYAATLSFPTVRQKWRSICEELPRIAQRIGDAEMIERARFGLGVSLFQDADFLVALEQFEQGYKLSAHSRKHAATWSGLLFGSWTLTLWVLGYPDRAMTRIAEAVAITAEIGVFADVILVKFSGALLNQVLRNWDMVYALADEAIRLGEEHGIPLFHEVIGYQRGWALAGLGRMEDGLAEMLRCRTALPMSDPWLFWGPAEAYLAAGRRNEGLQAVGEGLDLLRRGGNRWFDAELLRLKGELLLLGSNGSEAEASQCFRDAVEMARHQNAKSWELRATSSLARLLAQQGRRDEARTMLVEIYSWFTEGLDTADLKDAKALLEQL